MSVARKNIEFSKKIAVDRVNDSYIYGGTWNPFDLKQGCDCSGCVVDELDGSINGTAMQWSRHGLSTEDWRPPSMGGNADPLNGPFGTVMVNSPDEFPSNAAVLIAFHHGPGGGENSHTWCQVDDLRVETNGDYGTVIGSRARDVRDTSYANNWWYLPGPIIEDGTPRTEIPVTRQGVDYAGGKPSGTAIKAAGYDFVCRYLSDGGASLPGKLLTAAEVADLQANGIDIVSNWETTGTTALNGFDAGVADAQAADQVHQSLGGGSAPIFFSLDFDEAPAQDSVVFDYFRGVASVIGLPRTGAYGAYWILTRLQAAGLITYAWQTEAWSGDNTDPVLNILQDNNAGFATVGGVQCDINYALTTDFGQWAQGEQLSMADASTITSLISGNNPDGSPLIGPDGADYRRVDFLTAYEGPAVAGVGTYGADGKTPEGENTSRSLLDGFTTLAKILSRRYVNSHGQQLDAFDLLVGLYQTAGEPVVSKGPVTH